MSRYFLLSLIFFGFSCFGSESGHLDLDYYSKSQSTYGGIGLLQMPTARFSDEGEFAFGISREDPYRRLYSKVQVFPWLEAVIRYTEGTHRPYNPGSHQTWKDKGIDLKIRAFEEGEILPAVALGFTDFGGTGSFGGEYIVATKRVNNFDLTLGLGWGRFGGVDHISNPIGWISDDYQKRGGGGGALGGTIGFDRFFTGRTSFFGGFEYHTPIPNLSAKLEYDSSDYSDIDGAPLYFNKVGELDKRISIDSRLNVALNYQFNFAEHNKTDLSVGIIRGNTFFVSMAVHTNLEAEREPRSRYILPAQILNRPYLQPFSELNSDWQKYLTELIIWQMGNSGLITHNLIFNGNELQAEISQGVYVKPIRAIDIASRILANNSPTNINKITVINVDSGVETLRASIDRSTLVAMVAKGPLEEKYLEFNNDSDIDTDTILRSNDYLYPHFGWTVRPNLGGTIQHQIKFYFWQLEALFHAELAIKKGLYIYADYGLKIVNNYDDYTYHIPDGELHHVRQDRRLYMTEGESGLRKMALDYIFPINSDITAKVSAGYLEWMFGGIGGEVLYMPDDKPWALGADLYWLKQREYDQKFSFLDYETITAFANFYYDLPFYDLRFRARIGRFLAKDVGINFEISKLYSSGARVGAMASLTDCDKVCTGEGSFSKWVYFSMPMNLLSSRPTRAMPGYRWAPLTKDSGVNVEVGTLHELMTNAPDNVNALKQTPWSVKKIISGFGTSPKKKI